MVRTKVFVGNLAFKTTEAELAKEFAVAGTVISANIITRGPRSLGYGFVEFDSEEEANKAVTLLDKKEIDGRPVNVEVAKPRAEGEAENKQQDDNGAARGGFRRRGFRGRGRGGFRGGRGRGGFRGGRQAPGGGSEEVEDTNRPRGGFRRGRGGNRGRGGRGGIPAPRVPREQQPDTRVESKTTLFVANLPFALDDDGFGKVFGEAGLKFKAAHVVKKRNGRSKGFGFAEFDSEDDQKKALAALDKKAISERPLIVKIALTEDAAKTSEGQQQQAQQQQK